MKNIISVGIILIGTLWVVILTFNESPIYQIFNRTGLNVGIGLLGYLVISWHGFKTFMYYKKELGHSEIQNVVLVQSLYLVFIITFFSFLDTGFIWLNLIVSLISLALTIIIMLFIISSKNKKISHLKSNKRFKVKFSPSKKKFGEYIENHKGDYQSLFYQVVLDVYRGDIIRKLDKQLPIQLRTNKYSIIKGKPMIHCEGVYNDCWFQYFLDVEGLLIMVDGFLPNTKYDNDASIPYSNFDSLNDLYSFIVEGFQYYYDRVRKGEFDNFEDLNNFYR